MSSLIDIAMLLAGLAVVVAGAELLLVGLLGVASRLGASAFAVTAVISGFELENIAAGIAANANGLAGAAAGTFLGGTTFLALGVTGVAATIAPIRARLPVAALAWTAAAPLPLALLSLDGRLSRLDGALLVAWFAVALFGLARSGGAAGEREVARERRAGLRLLAGLAALAAGGDLLAEGLRGVVSRLGVSQTLLGNTVIAAAVEGEEVGRVAVSSRRGRGDVAIGNVTGTIVHFVALNAGVIALVKPLPLDHANLHLHLPVALGSAVGLAALLGWRGGVGRVAGIGLIALYATYIAAAIAAV